MRSRHQVRLSGSSALTLVGFSGVTRVSSLRASFQFHFPASQRLNCRVSPAWERWGHSAGSLRRVGHIWPSATTRFGPRLGAGARSLWQCCAAWVLPKFLGFPSVFAESCRPVGGMAASFLAAGMPRLASLQEQRSQRVLSSLLGRWSSLLSPNHFGDRLQVLWVILPFLWPRLSASMRSGWSESPDHQPCETDVP